METITRLIPNTQFGKTLENVSDVDYRRIRDNYDNLLSKSLGLGDFIPVSEAGEVLEEPDVRCLRDGNCQCGEEQVSDCREWKHEYQKAKDKIMFEGFEWNNNGYATSLSFSIDEEMCFGCVVEDLFKYLDESVLTLTPNALKLIYG